MSPRSKKKSGIKKTRASKAKTLPREPRPEFADQIGEVTGFYSPLASQLAKLRASGAFRKTEDLLSFDEARWVGLISQANVGVPSDIQAPTENERQKKYARLLTSRVERAFASKSVIAKLERSGAKAAGITSVLRAHPDLDLMGEGVQAQIKRRKAKVDPKALEELAALQRVLKVAERGDHAYTLWADRLHSAQAIARVGRHDFVRKYRDRFGEDEAQRIYTGAVGKAALAVSIYSMFSKRLSGPMFKMLPGIPTDSDGAVESRFPEWRDLFGELDHCRCDECQSVIGPSAYLVDLLQFINRPLAVPRNPLRILLDSGRRGDIGALKLTCANTNTLLPHIDIVNEILENAIAPPGGPTGTPGPTAPSTSDELSAGPERVNEAAYQVLSDAYFPMTLPFNRWDVESRAYLARIGASRSDVVSAFERRGISIPVGTFDETIARDLLGFSLKEWKLCTGQTMTTEPEVRELWGFSPTDSQWIATLGRARAFMDRSGLDSQDFLDFMGTRFVAGEGSAELEMGANPCDFEAARITGLNSDCLARMTRFLRVRKKLGLSIRELDKAWAVFGAIGTTFLTNLASVLKWKESFGVSYAEALSWLGKIDTWKNSAEIATIQDKSLYEQVFLSGSSGSSRAAFELNSGLTELARPTARLVDHRIALQSALRLTEAELEQLLASETGPELNLENLSILFRICSFCRANSISIGEFLKLKQLQGAGRFTALTPNDLRGWIDAIDLVKRSRFSVDELDAFLRGSSSPDDSLIEACFAELQKDLLEIESRVSSGAQSVAQGRERKVASVAERMSRLLGVGEPLIQALLQDALRIPTGSSNVPAIDAFLDSAFVSSGQARDRQPMAYQALDMLAKASQLASRSALNTVDAVWVVKSAAGAGWPEISGNSDPATPALFSKWLQWASLLRTRSSRSWHVKPGTETTGENASLDFFDLLRAASSSSLEEWLKQLNRQTGWDPDQIKDLVTRPELGWSFPADYQTGRILTYLKGCFSLSEKMRLSVRDIGGLGFSDPDFEFAEPTSRKVQAILKSRYGSEQWLKEAREIRSPVRERQRDALVAYMTGNEANGLRFADASQLFDHFLIDVKMSSCQLTSRVKQAISSTQLFIQRCFMNLEDDVSFNDSDAKRWKWMRNFRVWQANRKVFLYPENWIEPELRDLKSEFFEELEDKILQKEVTDPAVEDAFVDYLAKLDQVSRLEICGIYEQTVEAAQDEPASTILHVFGRTRESPYSYFYRQRLGQGIWTAWEKVDLEIEGDHLIPIIYNRRLYLFWPLFSLKPDEDAYTRNVASSQPKNDTQWEFPEIQFAWSVYRDRRWTSKRTVKEKIATGDWIRQKNSIIRHFGGFGPDSDTGPVFEGTLSIPTDQKEFVFKVGVEGDVLKVRAISKVAFKGHSKASSSAANRTPVNDSRYVSQALLLVGSQGEAVIESPRAFLYDYELATPVGAPPSAMEFSQPRTQAPATPLTLKVGALRTAAGGGYQDRVERVDAVPLLEKNPDRYRILYPHQLPQFVGQAPFFYQDNRRTYFVEPMGGDPVTGTGKKFSFSIFYHPVVPVFSQRIFAHGVEGLLNPPLVSESWTGWDGSLRRQTLKAPPARQFSAVYSPKTGAGGAVDSVLPIEDIDFEATGSYSQYNWELFFHAPLMIAERLSKNQRFEEAQKWFHFIFDPTASADDGLDAPARYWKMRWFVDNAVSRPIDHLLALLQFAPDTSREKREILAQVREWRDNPFNPHAIARLRPGAYQKAVVMKYLDNLIAWGDQLFRRDTLESINEATQLYVLAAQILGRKPEGMANPRGSGQEAGKSYEELLSLGDLDAFSNQTVPIENALGSGTTLPLGSEDEFLSFLASTLYFGVTPNQELLAYWDIVEDRLFKIRNCMDLDGRRRQLPLFEAQIDPALLVEAAAAGIDIAEVLSGQSAPKPNYRFTFLALKAAELVAEVKGLGNALVGAIEKKEAEELSLLRQDQELKVLAAVRRVKTQQLAEANSALEALKKTREMTNLRNEYYKSLRGKNEGEIAQLDYMDWSIWFQGASQLLSLSTQISSMLPQSITTAGVPPSQSLSWGGENITNSIRGASQVAAMIGSIQSHLGATSGIEAGYQRREAEWRHQEELTQRELTQIDQQIAGANIRVAIAERELENHDQQVENARAVQQFMTSKFASQKLYGWLLNEVSKVYFQSYQLAFDAAKRLENAFRYELFGDVAEGGSFLKPTYWSNLKGGLLAGEHLYQDLKRMEASYYEQSKREFEIQKNVSLAVLRPVQLLQLREQGWCEVDLTEDLFDADYPGHFMRRLKSVSVSIPCVTGPYTSVNCTLSLLSSSVRKNTRIQGSSGYGIDTTSITDSRFIHHRQSIESIATSSGQNDSGLFELSFRDERYLPFEGLGAVGKWRIELPKDNNAFDLKSVSDVVLHLRYTARDGGSAFASQVRAHYETRPSTTPMVRVFSAKREFSNEWFRFFNPPGSAVSESLEIDIGQDRFPFQFRNKNIQIQAMSVFLSLKEGLGYDTQNGVLKARIRKSESGTAFERQFDPSTPSTDVPLPHTVVPVEASVDPTDQARWAGIPNKLGKWVIEVDLSDLSGMDPEVVPWVTKVQANGAERILLNPDAIEDLYLACHFTA